LPNDGQIGVVRIKLVGDCQIRLKALVWSVIASQASASLFMIE
jgi:hypothetical protein